MGAISLGENPNKNVTFHSVHAIFLQIYKAEALKINNKGFCCPNCVFREDKKIK